MGFAAASSNVAGVRPELLDEAVIGELESLDGVVLTDLLSLYFDDAAGLISELGDAIGRGETFAVAERAHKLRGSSATIGAAHLSDIASELEARALAGDRTGMKELLAPLREGLDETRKAVRARATESFRAAMNAAAPQHGGNDPSRPSLLIADDDASVCSALSSQLDGDFRVIAVARHATEAIELAEEHRPDAALIDVEMPNGGAREAVPQIAARSPDTCMVILSGDESRQIVLELLSAGAIAYVRKGVTGGEISRTVTAALKVKAAHQPD
jgi:CheY-like chemotaxis protein